MTNFVKIINKIEIIRQEIFDITRENAGLHSFLDIISKSDKEYDEANKDYSENKKRIDYLSEKLLKIILELKNNNRKLVEKWVQIHIETCSDIINSAITHPDRDPEEDSTRIFVAKLTIDEWKEVLTTEKCFVIPNIAYLHDYNFWFKKNFNQYIDNQKDDSPR